MDDLEKRRLFYVSYGRIFGGLAAVFGVLVLIGWITGTTGLTSLRPSWIPTAPSTALLFVLFGISVVLLTVSAGRPRIRRSVLIITLASTLAALALLIFAATKHYFPIEHLGFTIGGKVGAVPAGHMSPLTAFCFASVGISLLTMLLSPFKTRAEVALAATPTSSVAAISFSMLLAYAFGSPFLYGSSIIPPAIYTTFAFLLLGIALVLLIIARPWPQERMPQGESAKASYALTLLFFALTLGVATTGIAYFRNYEKNYHAELEHRLSAVATLKISGIAKWRSERLGDGSVFLRNENFSTRVLDFLRSPDDSAIREHLTVWMHKVQEAYGYDRVFFADTNGIERIAAAEGAGPPVILPRSVLDRVLKRREVEMFDFHRDPPDLLVHLSVLVPVFAPDGSDQLLGILGLRIDPATFLYPFIQEWPTPSETAETLLVRRDGDDVVFLNELRFAKNTALTLRRRLADRDLPAGKAVRGTEGIVYGTDYRHVPVMAAVGHVPESPWFLVARMDMEEIDAPLREKLSWVVTFVVLLIVAIGLGVSMIWRNQKSRNLSERLAVAEALRQSEERHRITLMSVGDAVIATDRNGCVDMLNPTAETLTGWTVAEARGRPLEEIFHIVNEDTGLPVENPVKRVMREGVVVGLANHTVLISREGVEHPIADSGAPIRAEDGSISGVVMVFQDQTAERAAAKALADSLERYQSTLENMLEGCQILDSEWRYIYLNDVAAAHGHRPKADLIGRTMPEVYPGIEQTPLWAQLHRCMEQRSAAHIENEFIYEDGSSAWFDLSVNPVPEGLFILSIDVTKKKLAEDAVRESKQQIEFVLGATKTGLDIIDGSYTLRYVDPSWTKLYGDWRGRKCYEYFKGRTIPCPGCLILEGLANKTITVREETLTNEGDRPVQVTSIPYRDANGEWLVAEINVDITDIKRTEKERDRLAMQLMQSQKLEAIGRLAGGVAHDFNNILTAIQGFADLLRLSLPEGDPRREDVEQIIEASKSGASLTQQLLAFSRKQLVSPRVLNLNKAVDRAEKMIRRIIGEDIHLTFTPEKDLWRVRIDTSQVDQLLINLAVNARDAIANTGMLTVETTNVTLDVKACQTCGQEIRGDYVMLAVSDDGIGMSPETLAKIFEPFFTTKEKGKGTGLGLSTVHGIVHQNQGHINVYSEVGVGTTFKIYLPRSTEDEEVVTAAAPASVRYEGSESILLVEDQDVVRTLAERVLTQYGYRVLTASDGEEALRLAVDDGRKIDLLLTDVIMPKLNGKDLYERLRALRPNIRVLYMSGYTENVIAHHGVLDRGTAFVAKPFRPTELVRKVRDVLDETI